MFACWAIVLHDCAAPGPGRALATLRALHWRPYQTVLGTTGASVSSAVNLVSFMVTTVSSPSAVYLTVPPAYRAPPSWTYSTSPRRERSTAAAASATKKSSHLGLACLSTPATDDRSRQPRWTEEAFLVISDNAGGTLEPPCGRSSPAGLSPPVLVRLSPCDKKQRS